MKSAPDSLRRLPALGPLTDIHAMNRLPRWGSILLLLLLCAADTTAADVYAGHCDIVFEGDSTLHAFKGDITNIALLVLCETNTSGAAIISTRVEINPRQLTTHHT